MLHRLFLTLITIFFPPLTVLMITGPYADTLINSILFLCGVIPSHIHAFYISCTYFHRKRKVKKDKWPGPPKSLIFDRKVWYGGAKEWEVEELRVGKRKRSGHGSGTTSPSVDGRRKRSSQRRNSALDYSGTPVLPERRPSRGVNGYDRRSGDNATFDDPRYQMSNGLDRQRSVLGELDRQY